ncbi:MAG: HD-GYP domain-containing protein [Tissierellaceae bacterium]|nr:HD-GYP domain-containing protein [Tissierellaceae bacterium]
MNKGIHIGKKDSFLDRFIQNKAELRLLGKGDGSEVMLQKISANENVIIEPGDYTELMEFFYILDGELEFKCNKSKDILQSGDYFYTHHLKEHIQFFTITEVTLLYFSTQPIFHYLSSTIKDLVNLANSVEEKDIYTHGHIQRVKDYGLKIGNKMGLSKEKIENVGFAALFHDLGKLNVPDEILNKPGRLTDEEFEVIKGHSSWGAEIVTKTYFENISEIIKQHHERIDGSGYPNGLKGDEILIEARIIAVADSYDAMTSERSYKDELTPKVAIEELISLKGKLYDSDVVDALVEVLKDENII